VIWLFSQVLGKFHCNDNLEEKKSYPRVLTLLICLLANNHTRSALVTIGSKAAAFEELNEISVIWVNTFEIILQCA